MNIFKFIGWVILASLIIIVIMALCVWLIPDLEAGEPLKASWYSYASLKTEGTWKNGKTKMANGEWFDENAYTCATRLYPFGTFLCITNLNNGKSVIVRVTDRIGKRFATSRIDLSKKAFQQIADLRQGIVPIKVKEQ